MKCSICSRQIKSNEKPFIPVTCLQKWGFSKAHRICPVCWWSNFSKESSKHQCPGCIQSFPLTKLKKTKNSNNCVIDLT